MAPKIRTPTINVSPNVRAVNGEARVSIYRDKKGDIHVRQFGARLTPAEKKKGLSRAHGRVANSLRDFYSDPKNLDYKLKFTKSGGGVERTKNLMPATINGRKGWFDLRNGKFLFKEQVSSKEGFRNVWGEPYVQYGTIQLNLRSLDTSAYGQVQRGSLEDFYLHFLNAKEKAGLIDALNDRDKVDWNQIYSFFESSEPDENAPTGRPNYDKEKRGYDKIVSVIKEIVGGKWDAYQHLVGASS